MRHLAALAFACALVAGGGVLHAGKKKALKVKAALTCATTTTDGNRTVLGGKQALRLEEPITCMVTPTSVADGVELNAVVWVSYPTFDANGKKYTRNGPRHAVSAAYWADRHAAGSVSLTPNGSIDGGDDMAAGEPATPRADFEACLSFTVHAEIRGPQDVLAWKGKLAVKQDCGD